MRCNEFQRCRPSTSAQADEEDRKRNVRATRRLLCVIFPDADPGYLQEKATQLHGNYEELEAFVNTNLDWHCYVTKEEKRLQEDLTAQVRKYTDRFSAYAFLQSFPNPRQHFADNGLQRVDDDLERTYVLLVFRNVFDKLSARTIETILSNNNYAPLACYYLLKQENNTLQCKRKHSQLPVPPQNIALLQELAYIQHYGWITRLLKDKQRKDRLEFQMHQTRGTLQTCHCCFEEEVLPRLMVECSNGCQFCKTCVQRSTQVAFQEQGKLQFPCLAADCMGEYPLKTLQVFLHPELFAQIQRSILAAEEQAPPVPPP